MQQSPQDAAALHQLGRALLAVGDDAGARAVAGIDTSVGRNMPEQPRAYEGQQYAGRSAWQGYVELAAGHSSNVNAGPSADAPQNSPPGTPAWQLPSGAAKRSASFAAVTGHVRGRTMLNAQWSLLGSATAQVRGYAGNRAGDYDFMQTDLNAGLSYRRERHEWLLLGQHNYYRLDGQSLRTIWGLTGQWIYRLDGFRQWSSFVQYQQLRYPGHGQWDTHRYLIGTTYAHTLRSGHSWYAGVYGGEMQAERSTARQRSYDLWGLRAGGVWQWSAQWAAFTHASYERRDHQSQDVFFPVTRQDKQLQWALGLAWQPAAQWKVMPQWIYTRNRSTLPITQYTRKEFFVAVRRSF